jgi:hypothetical protein
MTRSSSSQHAAVEQLAKVYEGKAAWIDVTQSHRIPDWQREQAKEGEQGGVLINLSPSGRVQIREGLADMRNHWKPDRAFLERRTLGWAR